MEWLNSRNIEQFNGTRYGSWRFRIKTLLEELRVSSVIDESVPEYPNAEWIEKDSVAKCTIVNFLGDAFLHFAEGSVTAKSIIDNLDKLYKKRNLYTQLALRKQLFNLKLQPNMSLLQHFSIFDTLIANLSCSGVNVDEMDKICHLLMTLPFSYEEVVASLEVLHEEHFDLAFIKTVLLDYEAKMEIEAISKLKERHGLYVPNSKRKTNTSTSGPNKRRKPNNHYRNNGNFYRNPCPQMFCDYCGRQNHFIQDCHFYNRLKNDRGFYNRQNHDIPLMFPQFAPKVKTRENKNSHNRILQTVTVKQEPVSIKEEPIEIKDEPLWIKQEPDWEHNEQPIVIKTEPVDEQARINDGDTNVNKGQSRKRNRKRTSTKIIAMHIQAENAAQVRGNQQLPIV